MSDEEDTRTTAQRPGAIPLRFGGRFQVLRKLGEGGMGCVYEVRDLELDEIVALKLLSSADPDDIGRLRDEVRLARRISHPNVVRLFDLGEDDAGHFFTMELVPGTTLRDRIREGAIPEAPAKELALQIAAGLAAAHAAGVIHRDLKPTNVLLGKNQRVVLTDFGIARSAAASPREEVSGTEGYMSPEQQQGATEDFATDLYAFGTVLYEMLTGQRARSGVAASALAALPAELRELIAACLHEDPAERPSLAAIQDRLAGTASPARRPATSAKAIAILPPRVLGEGMTAEFAETMTQDWIDVLTRTRGLKVLGMGATRRFSASRDPLEVGAALGVDAVVDVTLRAFNKRIRLDARMLDAKDGAQLWAERLEDDLGAVMQLEETMASRVAEGLRVGLTAVVNRGAAEADVVELYLRGRAQLNRYALMGSDGAVALLEAALARAPAFAPARAALASARLRLWYLTVDPADARLAAAEVETSLRQCPDIPETQCAAGLFHWYLGREREAVAATQAALAMAPTYAQAHQMLGLFECESGRVEEGLRRWTYVLELEPSCGPAYAVLSGRYAMRGDFAAGEQWLVRAGKEGLAQSTTVMLARARLAALRGDAEGLSAVSQQLPVTSSRATWQLGADLLAGRVSFEEGRQRLKQDIAGMQSVPRRAATMRQIAAELWASLQQWEDAEESVRLAIEGGLLDLDWMQNSRLFVPCRARSGWRALEAKLKERVDALWRDSAGAALALRALPNPGPAPG